MILASELRAHTVIQLDGAWYTIIEADYHTGGGKMGAMVHAKLENLKTRHQTERRFAPTDKLDDVALERRQMEYLYRDGEAWTFMDVENFEQISLGKNALGAAANYLREGMKLPVELHEGSPVNVVFPKDVEVRVAQTGPAIRGGQDTTYKEATLENGQTVMVPQFIVTGDLIKVEVATGHYLERVREEKKI